MTHAANTGLCGQDPENHIPAGTHAKVLSMKRLRMDYELVAGVLNILKQTHYLYKDVSVEDDTKCSWDKMRTGVQVCYC